MHFFTSKTNSSLFAAMACVFLFASDVSAHGRMQSPAIRLKPGDQDQGFTVARGPTKIQPCGDSVPSASATTFSSGASMPIQWEIGAAHKGTCFVELSTADGANFRVLKEFPNCADANGVFNDNVQLPAGVTCEKCIVRWRWVATLTNELYLNCADIKITGGSDGGAKTPTPPASGKNPATPPVDGKAPAASPTNGEESTAPPAEPAPKKKTGRRRCKGCKKSKTRRMNVSNY